MGRKATIGEVAREAGVSVATADRVLNGRGGVSPGREARVLAAARLLKLDRALASRGYARTLRVAVLIQAADNPFHAALRDAFRREGMLRAGLNLQFLIHFIDPLDGARTAAAAAALGATHDGMIVTCPDHPAVAGALRAVAARIPVLTLATDIPGCGRHAYVGPDDRRAGRVAGDLMGRLLGPAGGAVLVLIGLSGIAGHREREAGFRAVLSEHHPKAFVALVEESREEAGRAGRLVLSALGERPNIAGVYNASAGAGPVVAALRARGREDVVVVTHELTDDRRALLRARAIHAVVDQNPDAEVRLAADTMARLLGRMDGAVGDTETPVQIFMAENV